MKKTKQIIRKKLKAGFTIEASVIVPLTMILVAAVMVVCFMLHDRVILSTVSIYEVMEHASRYKDDPDAAQSGIGDMLGKRLITAKNESADVEQQEGGLKVTAAAELEAPLGGIHKISGTPEQIQCRINISNLNARERLVRYKTICDGLSLITEGEDGK